MDKTALRLLIKKVIAEGIKYDAEMKQFGKESYLYGFAATYIDEFEAILKSEIKGCDHYFPINKKGIIQPCEFCGEIKQTKK